MSPADTPEYEEAPQPQPQQSDGEPTVAPAEDAEDAQASPTGGPQPGSGAIHYSAKQAQEAKHVLKALQALRRAVRFYPLDHPSVTVNVAQLAASLRAYHDEGVELQLAFFEGEVLLGDQLLAEESVVYDRLARDLQDIGVGSLIFRPGVDEGELARIAVALGVEKVDADAAGGVLRMAEAAQLPHVQIGVVFATQPEFTGTEEEMAHHAFNSAIGLLEDLDDALSNEKNINPSKVRNVVRSLVDSVLNNRYSMLQLTGLKNYDEYTFYHSVNVAILSLALGSLISKDEKFLSSLGTGALMHDIGKLSVGHDIINKPGQLTPEEWEWMQRHPVLGAEMIAMMPGVDKTSIVSVLEHHMRCDGAGYPSRPFRKQHLVSRIVAVADAYDAMTSRRSYSAARVQDEAMNLLVHGSGSSLDPTLVRLFVGMLGMYPPRTVVQLSSGEVAIVVSPTEGEPLRPTVRVITSIDGDIIDEPFDIPLTERHDLSVEGTLESRLLNIQVEDYM